MGRPAIDLTGMEIGRLTVLNRDISKPSGAGKSVIRRQNIAKTTTFL